MEINKIGEYIKLYQIYSVHSVEFEGKRVQLSV